MSHHTTKEAAEVLESLVDLHGLQAVLAELETICDQKAEHIATNWQDYALAKSWCRTARRIGAAIIERGIV